MRLWHKDMIPVLSNKHLIAQWRECCAIMAGIAKNNTVKHPLVKKILNYPLNHFLAYSAQIYGELFNRGYNPAWKAFWNQYYKVTGGLVEIPETLFDGWHNDRYLRQCMFNLQEKYDCGVITDQEWMVVVDRFGEP